MPQTTTENAMADHLKSFPRYIAFTTLSSQPFCHRRQSGCWSMMLFIFLCLLFLITFSSFMFLEMGSRRRYSMTFPNIDLTSSSPDPPLPLWRWAWYYVDLFQLSGTFLSHLNFSLRIDSKLATMSAPSTPSGASHQLFPDFCSPTIGCPLYQYAHRSGGCFYLWRMKWRRKSS